MCQFACFFLLIWFQKNTISIMFPPLALKLHRDINHKTTLTQPLAPSEQLKTITGTAKAFPKSWWSFQTGQEKRDNFGWWLYGEMCFSSGQWKVKVFHVGSWTKMGESRENPLLLTDWVRKHTKKNSKFSLKIPDRNCSCSPKTKKWCGINQFQRNKTLIWIRFEFCLRTQRRVWVQLYRNLSQPLQEAPFPKSGQTQKQNNVWL